MGICVGTFGALYDFLDGGKRLPMWHIRLVRWTARLDRGRYYTVNVRSRGLRRRGRWRRRSIVVVRREGGCMVGLVGIARIHECGGCHGLAVSKWTI
jgi:hypothetical protein